MEIFDLAIIGLGPGGHRAALGALKCGLKTVAFEKACPGGTCLNLGCIPTKAIMHSSETQTGLSFQEIIDRKNKIVEKFSSAVKKDLISKGLVLVEFEAHLKEEDGGKFTIIAGGKEYRAEKTIIATGSAPFELQNLKFNHKNILNSNDILNLTELPKSIAIIGSGAIGIEWARIFSNLNIPVTVIEKAQNLLPTADLDVSKRILRMFKMAKIPVFTEVEALSYKDGVLELSNGKNIECDKILVAVGRKRIFPEIVFKNANGKLAINPDGTTNLANVYAIGDIMAKKMLAHTATAQAVRLLANFKTGCRFELKDEEIPSVVYGCPEIASIGLREQDLPENYKENSDYKIYNLPVAYLAKAWCDNEIEGFIKIITHCGRILGAHIISKEASAMMTQLQIAMKANMTVETLRDVVFAHPTYSEGIWEAIL